MNTVRKNRKGLGNYLLVSLSTVAIGVMSATVANAQVTNKGLPPASNTSRSFVDASIVRDSGINQPLDLLNDFYPAIEVTISERDNLRRRSDIEENDTVIAAMPSLAYRTNLGRHQFYAAYSGIFTFHDELDEEDAESNNLLANLGLDISRRWDLNLMAGIGESFEERGVSGSRPFNQFITGVDTGPDEIDYSFYGADLIYGKKVSPLIAILGFEKHETGYINNFQGDENLFGGRDRETDTVRFDLSYKIGAKTSLFGRISRQDIDYDRALNSLDSEQTDWLLGVRWKPSNALSGVVGIGNTDREFDDPRRAGYDDTSYYANLNYMINPFSIIEFSASRSVEEPGDDVSNFYVSDLIGVGWDHALTPQLVFNAFAKWVDDDYDTGRQDEFFDFGLGLDYVWRSWLTAGIYYGEIERDSSVPDFDYDDRYYGIRIRSDLRSLLRGRGKAEEPASFNYPRPSDR